MLIQYPSEDLTGTPVTMPYYKQSSNPSAQPISDSDVLKQGIQETQVSLQKYIILFILRTILSSSSIQRATRTRRTEILIMSHIGVHKVYYETCALFSSTKLRIYNKDKHKQEKLVLLYKSTMELNTFLFESAVPKIGHDLVGQDKVAPTYVQVVAQ